MQVMWRDLDRSSRRRRTGDGRAAGAQDGRRVGCPAERVAEADRPHETRRRSNARDGGRRLSSPFGAPVLEVVVVHLITLSLPNRSMAFNAKLRSFHGNGIFFHPPYGSR